MRAEAGVSAQERLHLRFALLRLQGTGAVDQPPAGEDAVGGGVQQARLGGGQPRQVPRPRRVQHVRVAAEGAGGRARRVQQHEVEPAGVGPAGRVRRHGLRLQPQAQEVLGHALQPGGGAVQGGGARAGGRELQRLAAGRGAQVEGALPRPGRQQPHGDGGGRVLHPPAAFGVARPVGQGAPARRAHGAGGQHHALQLVGQARGVRPIARGEVGGGLQSDLRGQGGGLRLAVGGAPAGEQPVGGVQLGGLGGEQGAGALAVQGAQHRVEQAAERAGRVRALRQGQGGGHGGEGGGVQQRHLGEAQAQQGAHRRGRRPLQLGVQHPVQGGRAAQHGGGQRAGEGAVAPVQRQEARQGVRLLRAPAARQGRLHQGQRRGARVQPRGRGSAGRTDGAARATGGRGRHGAVIALRAAGGEHARPARPAGSRTGPAPPI